MVADTCEVLIFGDPDNGTPVGTIPSSKVLVICHSKDEICKGSIIVTSDHLNVSHPSFMLEPVGLYLKSDGLIEAAVFE